MRAIMRQIDGRINSVWIEVTEGALRSLKNPIPSVPERAVHSHSSFHERVGTTGRETVGVLCAIRALK